MDTIEHKGSLFITPKAAASVGKVSENSWYYLARNAKIETLRIGGRVFLSAEAVALNLEERGLHDEAAALRARLA